MARIPPRLIFLILPVLAAVLMYHLDELDPVSYPDHELPRYNQPLFIPKRNSRMLQATEMIGDGQLFLPEDIDYDPKTGIIYTGCADGWISRIDILAPESSATVEKWVNTGGRPLGIAHGPDGEVLVADADKGLLKVSKEGVIELLTDKAEDIKFKMANAVVIGPNQMIYFTDSSFKYSIKDHILDIFEGRPNGRLLSYNPVTKETKVLVRDLYFPNGVTLAADQQSVIFCETPMRRCRRYYVEGPREGSNDMFVENLPGLPDNIRYDGEGRYWIALCMEADIWVVVQGYPMLRKVARIVKERVGEWIRTDRNGGVIAIDVHGKPDEHYFDRKTRMVSSAMKIGEHLYCGSIVLQCIIRVNLTQNPATPTI